MSNAAAPLVSIVIPTYNNRDYICTAIDSALNQTHAHREIIVVDDGSTDDTPALLGERYGDQIQVIGQPNSGPAAARNRGIEAARGEWIQFCDADDVLLPDKIEACLHVGEQNPNAGVVYTRLQPVLVDGVTPADMPDTPLPAGDIFCDLLRYKTNLIQLSTMLVRRDILLEIGMFTNLPELRCAEDWDLSLRLATRTTFAPLDQRLVHYRIRPDSVSRDGHCTRLGRLTVAQRARHYPGRAACMGDAEYDRFEAGLYHAFAVVLWEMDQRGVARSALRQAIRLDPQHSAIRRIYWAMSFVFPARARTVIPAGANLVKRLAGRTPR